MLPEDTAAEPVADWQDVQGTGSSTNPSKYLSSWHLLRIESASGQHYIDFAYAKETYSYLSPAAAQTSSYIYTTSNGGTEQGKYYVCSGSGGGSEAPHYLTESGGAYHHNVVYGRVLSSITGGTTRIDFVRNQTRLDLVAVAGHTADAPRRLDQVKVIEGYVPGSSAAADCQVFDLDYTYSMVRIDFAWLS